VMYLGRIVPIFPLLFFFFFFFEIADRDGHLLADPPENPTRSLMAAVRSADPEVKARRPRAVIRRKCRALTRPPPG